MSMMARLSKRVARLAARNRWEWLIALGLNNLRVNRAIRPLGGDELRRLGLPVKRLELTTDEYRQFVSVPALRSYGMLKYCHSKVLEYLTTARLLELRNGMHLLDAAGGSTAEYLRAVSDHVPGVHGYIQDPFAATELKASFEVLTGSIEAIGVAAQSLDAISCHHSIEHFRDDLDSRFIEESIRVLRPGGRLVIVPVFITTTYAEIWLHKASAGANAGDPAAQKIIDRTATFAGWGPYEGFARTYDVDALRRRILSRVTESCSASIYEIRLDGKPAPDLRRNHHQPLCNGDMKALLIEKMPPRER
jgi:SAM-dependent methyltransferase